MATQAITLKDLLAQTARPVPAGQRTPMGGTPQTGVPAPAAPAATVADVSPALLSQLGLLNADPAVQSNWLSKLATLLGLNSPTGTDKFGNTPGVLPTQAQVDAYTAAQTPAAQGLIPAPVPAATTGPMKPDASSGDFWKTETKDGTTTTVFDSEKYQTAYDAWYNWMKQSGTPAEKFNASPAGTVGQVGAGTDVNGRVYSAIKTDAGGLQMLSPEAIQARQKQVANPRTSSDQAIADRLIGIIRASGVPGGEPTREADGSYRFQNADSLALYTGLVSTRMLDVYRNSGNAADALDAGGYKISAKGIG